MQRIALQVTQRYIGAEGHCRPGDIVNVDVKRARQLIDNGVAKVRVGPTEVKTEPKPENNAKKSSTGRRGGRSTRTASSTASGPATPSSASPAAPALPESNANTSGAHGAAGLTFTS